MDDRIETARSAFATAASSADGSAQDRAAVEARAGFERWIDAVNRRLTRFPVGDRERATALIRPPASER